MYEHYNHHYIRTDASGNITEGWSDGPHRDRTPTEDDILLTDKGGYQFRLFLDGEENPHIFDWNGMIPLYKYEDGEVVKRTEEEVELDRAALPGLDDTPTEAEDTASMLVDHEYRLTLLELGLSE